jgi:hypothetical protein
MKKLLSAAAVALLSTAGVAHADFANSSGSAIGALFGGPFYSEIGGAFDNAEAASPTVTNTWTLTGNVTPDCSYYGGSSSSHTLDFGQIGVNTQANTNINSAFNMVAPAVANVNTTVAGCNTNNTVKITKANGTQGLKNTAGVGYDSAEFQANIPYSVTANFRATVNTGSGQNGSSQSLIVSSGEGTDTWAGGAWRSSFNMLIATTLPSKGLIAGTYSDTLTVELAVM